MINWKKQFQISRSKTKGIFFISTFVELVNNTKTNDMTNFLYTHQELHDISQLFKSRSQCQYLSSTFTSILYRSPFEEWEKLWQGVSGNPILKWLVISDWQKQRHFFIRKNRASAIISLDIFFFSIDNHWTKILWKGLITTRLCNAVECTCATCNLLFPSHLRTPDIIWYHSTHFYTSIVQNHSKNIQLDRALAWYVW